MFLYLDEAGDLGFNFTDKKPSNYFVITLLVCDTRVAANVIRQAAERTLKVKLHAKSKNRKAHELKGTGTEIGIKKYFFKHARKNNNWNIYSIVLDKKIAIKNLSQPVNVHRLYNVLSNVLLKQVDFSNASTVSLFVDRSKNRDGVIEFDTMLQASLDVLLPLNVPLNIMHADSAKIYGIQAVDLFCWGMFRKYELNDTQWYEMFKQKVIFEQKFQA